MSLRITEEEYAALLARQNRAAVRPANAKQVGRDAAAPAAKAKEVHSRVRIRVHHRTRRLADATGRSHKAAVDGIVRGGILIDDSPKFVEKISETFEQSKIEETIIEVWEI